MPLCSDIQVHPPGLILGHVWDAAAPDRRWHVGLFHRGNLLGSRTANLSSAPGSDRPLDCGFAFDIAPGQLSPDDILRFEVLNTDHVIGEISAAELALLDPQQSPATQVIGTVRQVQGLTLTGTIGDGVTAEPSYEIIALEDDRIVGRSRLWRWRHVDTPGNALGRSLSFDLLLDPSLADGRPHRIHVQTSTGRIIGGSPLDILALPNPVRDALVGRAITGGADPAGRMADAALSQVFGTSMPLSAYGGLYPELAALKPAQMTDSADPFARRIGMDGRWRPIPGTNWLLCHHRALTPDPAHLERIATTLAANSCAPVLILSDLAVRMADEQIMPLLFSAFDLERLLEQGHVALCFAIPETALDPDATSLVDLLLTQVLPAKGSVDRHRILHLPHPAGVITDAALIETALQRGTVLSQALTKRIGTCTALPRGTKITRAPTPDRGPAPSFPALCLRRPLPSQQVSVIIPTRNHGEMLERAVTCLIAAHPELELDILIVDNASDEPATHEVMARLAGKGARIIRHTGGFNYARINNLAARAARHELLCFMNNDVEFPSPGVLNELASRLGDPGVGAAGPLMTRASDIIQHGGVVLGPQHVAAHAFEDRMFGDRGPAEMLRVAHETSAVTAALMLTRRSLFLELGGFDEEKFPVNFNDVDYCLRLWERGLRVVFSPHLRVMHLESASRGRERNTPAGRRLERELANLRAKWRATLLDDPQYHPLLASDMPPWRALATHHRATEARHAAGRPAQDLPAWL